MFFALFDGRDGPGCAEFMRDNLHKHIAESIHFPQNMRLAIIEGFEKADLAWLKECGEDRSGCSAVVAILSPSGRLVFASLGDCRACICDN